MKKRRPRVNDNRAVAVGTLPQRLAKAQQLVRKHLTPAVSLADELIAERRKDARRE